MVGRCVGRVGLGLLVLFAAGSAGAQSVADGEKALRDALLKKQLYLRGFSADKDVLWRWNGTALVMSPPAVHTLAVFTANALRVKASTITIQGDRQTLMRKNAAQLMLSLPDPVELHIELGGADVATVLPEVEKALFYAKGSEALADLPKQYQGVLPAFAKREADTKLHPNTAKCDCAEPSEGVCKESPLDYRMKGVEAPRLTHEEELAFSDEARNRHFSGTLEVGFIVNAAGIPEDLWIIRPAPFGLNAQAAVMAKYRFAPATCHGKPVPFRLSEEMKWSSD